MHAFADHNDLSSDGTCAFSSPESKSCANDSETSQPTLSPGAFIKAFTAKSAGKPNSSTTAPSPTGPATLQLFNFRDVFRPRKSERHPFFGIATDSMRDFFDAGDDGDDNTAGDWLDASSSVLALQDGQLSKDDDDITVIASGKRSSSRSSLTTHTTEPTLTSSCRAADVQNKIQMMDRQNLISQLLVTEDLQNQTGPPIPIEVSFAPKRSSSKKRRKPGSKIYNKRNS